MENVIIDFDPTIRSGKIKFSRVKDVKPPNYGTIESGGIDFFVPNTIDEITLKPGEDALIPSGIKVNLPPYTALIGIEKSGVSIKTKLHLGAKFIDSDYTGEVHIHVHNIGLQPHTIKPGDKIMQFAWIPILLGTLVEVDVDHLYINKKSERGEGGFGSTGVK